MRNFSPTHCLDYARSKSICRAVALGFLVALTLSAASSEVLGEWQAPFAQGIPTSTAPGLTPTMSPGAPQSLPGPARGMTPTSQPVPLSPAPTFTQPNSAPGTFGQPNQGHTQIPGYNSSGIQQYPPGQVPAYAPGASLQGTIAPPPGWDAWGTPGQTTPGLFQQTPYPTMPGPYTGQETFAVMQRFMDELRLDYVWIPGNGSNEFGTTDVDLSASFAIPLFRSIETPLLVTPGFAFHLWSGPQEKSFDLPSRVWDAYIDAAWAPRPNEVITADLALRVGVYSDFEKLASESLRYQGRAVLSLAYSNDMEMTGGIYYLDRARVKLLPVFGLVLTPNSDARLRLVFPDPKLSWRLNTYGNTDWWWYLRGEYGGGSWSVRQPSGVTRTDYNDVRIGVGIEWENPSTINGLFEVGGAFNREIYFDRAKQFDPATGVYLRGGLTY